MTHAYFRERALALHAWLDAVTADVLWPPHLQPIVDRCRDDLALTLAGTESDTVTLPDGARIESFEALRLMLRQP